MNASLWMLSPFAFALGLAPLCAAIGRRTGFVDRPRADRFAAHTTPKLGGVVVALALLPLGWHVLAAGAGKLVPAAVAGFAAAFLVGLVDDARALRPRVKLLGQIFASGLSVGLFAWQSPPPGPLADVPPWLVVPAGVVWVTAFQNAVNFLDNMDGIVAGLVGIGLAALALALPGHERLWPLGVAAACAGFLPWNVARPARLFLGDAGSLPLGHALGFVSLAAAWSAASWSGVAAAVVVVLLPVLDITFVTITRLRAGRSPAIGGRDHTTHRLYASLRSVRRTVWAFWLVAIGLGATSLWMRSLSTAASLGVLAVLGILFAAAGVRAAALPVADAAAPRD